MGFKCGIVGLPNVGKSTLFNALTQVGSAVANYPFCTVEPHVGVVPVPDSRLDDIASIVKPQKVTPTAMEFVDIAGLVAGASKGEGLGNQFLAHIRETDAIVHVVRCFRDQDVAHVGGNVMPRADIETVNTELMLADLDTVERSLERCAKAAKAGDKQVVHEKPLLERVGACLEKGIPVHSQRLAPEELTRLRDLHLLTAKPTLYIPNVDEEEPDKAYTDSVYQWAREEEAIVIPICASLEAELAELSEEDRAVFLEGRELKEPGLYRVIRAGYRILGLQTFFTTVGTKEVRAWAIPVGSTALQAAGVVHSDFKRGFIRAEVISYEDYVRCRGEKGAKEAGKWRLEGKDYKVQDGDVIRFRFNI